MQEQQQEDEEEQMIRTRYLAWASLKPWSEKNFKPTDLLKLPGDELAEAQHYQKLKQEGRIATIRKQTPEEQELMARIRKKHKQ